MKYYESTAVRGHEYCGGLSEYYSERDTRAPVMFVVGTRSSRPKRWVCVTERASLSPT
ncbi:hypothetical protein L838_1131 [Mycobacterium avium MAV_120709_2344]|nr:hypothetical protein L838_1131 [Mycobacterium avium MAV_120709_2344]